MNGSAIRHSIQCGRTYALRPEGMSLRLTKTFCDFAVKRKKMILQGSVPIIRCIAGRSRNVALPVFLVAIQLHFSIDIKTLL